MKYLIITAGLFSLVTCHASTISKIETDLKISLSHLQTLQHYKFKALGRELSKEELSSLEADAFMIKQLTTKIHESFASRTHLLKK